MILTPQEIRELTQRARPAWQVRVLDHIGVPYRRRPDGTLIVMRSHVEMQPVVSPRRPQLRLDT